ncbi:MAG: PAS domain S-box protein [Thermomicrobiales bacterium]
MTGSDHIVATQDLPANPASDDSAAPPDAELAALRHTAQIVASCPDPIIGETLDGIINFWNPAAEQLYGYAAADAIGQPVSMLAPPGREAELTELLERVRQGSTVEAFETVRQTHDGRLIDVSLSLFPVRDADGAIIGLSASTRDITQRRRDAAALAVSERRFRAAFDDTPTGMALVGLDGRFLQVNRAGAELLGRPEADLLRLTVADVTHPDDVERDRQALERTIAGEQPYYEHELRVWQPDGNIRWVRVHGALVRDAAGKPAYFVGQMQDLTAVVAAEESLAAALHSTQEVLEQVVGLFIEVDREWRIVQLNEIAAGVLGRDRAELVGQSLLEAASTSQLEPLMATLQFTMVTRQRAQIAEVSCDDGVTWATMRVDPTAHGISLLLRDITEHRRLAEELRAAELRFQSLVEQLPAAVYLHADDDDETTLYLSPYFETLTGYPNDEQSPFRSFPGWVAGLHPDDRERILHEGAARDRTPGQYLLEYRFRRKDGAYIWVNDIYSSMLDDHGQIIAWQGIILDVTERKEASAAIARLAAIVEASEDAIYSRTLEGLITYWNPAAERLYGYAAAEIIGQPVTRLFLDGTDHISTSAADFDGHAQRRFEAQDLRKDGSIVEVAASLFPVRDSEGRLLGISGIARDISERIAAEREVRTALEAAEAGSRAKGLFLAMMSHELRTPLQAVLGYADFLLSGRQGILSPEQLEDIGYIHQGASRMVHLIDQMLDLSRMEAGRLELKQEPVDVRRVMELVRQDIAPLAEAKGLALTLQAPARVPSALGDAERVRQILLNLAGNAVKFTEVGGIRLTARDRHGWVEVTVQDTGIGIAQEELATIFEEFRQVDSTLSRRHGGAGLGLAIARRLTEQMGGELTVTSRAGAGSTFTLRLPMAR